MDFPDIDILSRDVAQGLLCAGSSTIKHIISISDENTEPPRGYKQHPARKIALQFYDITPVDYEGKDAPQLHHVEQILEFAKDIGPGEYTLIHCNAGISRSSASALAVIASKLEPTSLNAFRAVETLKGIKQIIHPSHRMVRYADQILGYKGALEDAYKTAFGKGDLIDWGMLQRLSPTDD